MSKEESYIIVSYGHKTHKVYRQDTPEDKSRKSRWLHPDVKIRVITNYVKPDKESVNNALMNYLYENGYSIHKLSYKKTK